MRRKDIEGFFEVLARKWPSGTKVILTGGTASLLMGGKRPTLDIDFEVAFRSKRPGWAAFEKAVRETEKETGISAQFSEEIERWSQISYLDYRKHVRPFGKFGRIELCILEPVYWSIGKIARYWDQDIQDLICVFKKEGPEPVDIARLWLKALRKSPPSSALFTVRQNAIHFFKTFGRRIWGKHFAEEEILPLFTKKTL